MPMHNAAIRISHPNHIDLSWANRIATHHQPSADLRTVKVHKVDVGTTTRINVEVEHDHEQLPQRWFVKIPSLSIRSRLITALPRFLHKEICFYRSLAPQLPVKLPQILASTSQFGIGSTLVMGDLADQNARAGLAGEAIGVTKAKNVLSALAKLHAHNWNNRQLSQQYPWLNDWSHQMETHMGTLLAKPLMARGLKLASEWVEPSLHKPALRYAEYRSKAKQFLADAPQTLVHYDCHPGNLFWQDEQPGFLDWQLVRLGEGVGDVAYFMANALSIDDRRQYEHQLLEHYAAQLNTLGVSGIDQHQLFKRYQAHLVYPFEAMVVTLSIGGMMHQASNIEMIKRSAAAVTDHDSFSRIRYA